MESRGGSFVDGVKDRVMESHKESSRVNDGVMEGSMESQGGSFLPE